LWDSTKENYESDIMKIIKNKNKKSNSTPCMISYLKGEELRTENDDERVYILGHHKRRITLLETATSKYKI